MASTTYGLSSNNTLEQFNKTIPGNKDVPQDMDVHIHPSGDFIKLEGIDVIVRGCYTLLTTLKGSYLFDPEYGIGLHRYIFEPCDEITKEELEREVSEGITRYITRANISVSAIPLTNRKGYTLNLTISYKGEKRKVTITVDEELIKTLPEGTYTRT